MTLDELLANLLKLRKTLPGTAPVFLDTYDGMENSFCVDILDMDGEAPTFVLLCLNKP